MVEHKVQQGANAYYEDIPLLPYSEAQKMEVSRAEALREKGYAVWQK